MVKPLGGRGKRAPYDTVQMRVPLPIKTEVQFLIDNYRNAVLLDDAITSGNEELTGLVAAIKLVDRFIEETGQTENLHQRNNTNLVRFRNWLLEKSANSKPDS